MSAENSLLKQLYDSTLSRRLALLQRRSGASTCTRYTDDHCADYLDLMMPEPERIHFERHYPDCVPNLSTLLNLIEADRDCDDDPRLSEIGQCKSRNKALQHVAAFAQSDSPLLLAAAAPQALSRKAALGIGIDLRSGKGQILECVAHVQARGSTDPGLQVIGSQVMEHEINGRRVGITPPLSMIQDVLSVVCKSNPLFKKRHLSARAITVQISQPHESFLSEGRSLTLAAVAALYAELENRTLPDDLVMSGCVDITGSIHKVSHVREKAELAVQHGKTVMILSAENLSDVDQLDPLVREKIRFCFVQNLTELFECLDGLATPETDPADDPALSASTGRLFECLYRIDRYPVAIPLMAFVILIGWAGGWFQETARYILNTLMTQQAVYLLPLVVALLAVAWAGFGLLKKSSTGLLNRLFFYSLFLLIVPTAMATFKTVSGSGEPAPLRAESESVEIPSVAGDAIDAAEQILSETPRVIPPDARTGQHAPVTELSDQTGDYPDTGFE